MQIAAERQHRYADDLAEITRSAGGTKFPYRKTHDFPGDTLHAGQAELLSMPLQEGKPIIAHEIEGWLRPEDAAKLYELAWFCGGDIIELGTSRGLSAFIMDKALREAGREGEIHTVDLRQDCCDAATKRMRKFGARNVVIECNEGAAFIRKFAAEGRKFSLAFVDHAHTYEPVREACSILHTVLEPGSFAAFHDFCDSRNFKEEREDFGVFAGVTEGLSPAFEFWGAFGCLGLYRLTA